MLRPVVVCALSLFALFPPVGAVAQTTEFITESIDLGGPDLPGFVAANGINKHLTVVGTMQVAEGDERAFVWTRRTGFEIIANNAIAWDVNDRGLVVGERHGAEFTSGFSWTRRDGFTELGPFIPYTVNNAGVMAGVCTTDFQPCTWKDGVLTALTGVQGWAWGINDRGDAVGSTFTETAFLWPRKGDVVDLGPGLAEDINDRGTIAGHRLDGASRFATIWTGKRTPTPFAAPGVIATRINDRDWVLTFRDNQTLVWDSRTDAEVALRSSRGGAILAFDMNDRGDVVGSVAIGETSRVLIWRVRGKHLNAAAGNQ